MKVGWQMLSTDYAAPPNAGQLVARLQEVTPELLERLHKRFGGELPDEIALSTGFCGEQRYTSIFIYLGLWMKSLLGRQ